MTLAALARITIGELELRLPNGVRHHLGTPGSGPAPTVTVTSDDLFRRLAWRGQIGLGESYAAGDWHADDLVAFLELLALNRAASEHVLLSALTALDRFPPLLPSRRRLRRDEANIHYHYDIGNDFYRLFLDESLTYSCAYFEQPRETLEQAQQNKYRRICDKLELSPKDHVLDIGCGWGGFALHVAGEHGARVTGLTLSKQQHELARERVAAAGLDDRVEILYRDYRRADGRFTKIASIEMFEAIGYEQFGTFFATCDRLLAPGGLVCIQTIAIPDKRFEHYRRGRDWIREYIFPGALIPSLSAFSTAMSRSSGLSLHSLEDIGSHYARTLREWRERYLENIEEVRKLGFDARFERTWEFYLAASEAAFARRSLQDFQILLTRPCKRPPAPLPLAEE